MKSETKDPYLSLNRLVYVDKYRNIGLEGRVMDQAVRNKIAKNKGWLVCKSWTDHENKKFMFECMKNAHNAELKEVTFEEAKKVLEWTKLEFEKDKIHIKFDVVRYAPNIDPANPNGPLVPDENGFCWHVAT